MCGIAGIMSHGGGPVAMEDLRAMCAAMAHRGPNDEGFYQGRSVGLGMRRLSIIDLEGGHQPVSNEDASVWVVLNGEIYNYQELRRNLEQKGHVLRTASDTETIVHLYEDYGTRCVEYLRGMFAFAVWDEKRGRLLLARDRLGIKPLFYAETGGTLAFASELKALLQLSDIERSLSWRAVNHLFTFCTTPRSESIIEGVRKLEPGRILTGSPGADVHIERYWSVCFEPDYGLDGAYCVDRLRELVEESVKLHLASDVPLGAFLSGGLDSSSVVAAMSRTASSGVKTFSIGFQEADYDESGFARIVAGELGTDHHEMIVDPDVWEIMDDLVWYLDEPFGDSSAIPTYMVSKLAAKHVKVVLSGDGGDELFAGYDRYVVEERERRMDGLPAALRKGTGSIARWVPEGVKGHNFLRHFSLSGWERYLDASTLFREEEKDKLFRADARRLMSDADAACAGRECLAGENGHWLSAVQRWDLEGYLPLDILTKVDRMSMAHSLEARVPLLDHKLVEFVAAIPPALKLRAGTTKYIFKKALRGILPDQIIDRPKQGFAAPLGRWFRGELDGFVRELLLSDGCRRRGVFDTAYVARLLSLHKKRRDLDLKLWTLVSFELWCRKFLDRDGGGAALAPRAASSVVFSGNGIPR